MVSSVFPKMKNGKIGIWELKNHFWGTQIQKWEDFWEVC